MFAVYEYFGADNCCQLWGGLNSLPVLCMAKPGYLPLLSSMASGNLLSQLVILSTGQTYLGTLLQLACSLYTSKSLLRSGKTLSTASEFPFSRSEVHSRVTFEGTRVL